MGVNPITEPALASEKKCDWLASRSDICSSAAKVIVSADPHVQWGEREKKKEKKKSLFSQRRYEMVTFAGVVWRRERERERDSADKKQEGRDVSDILMYVWR